MFDPDARPIRKGKLRAPTEFGYVFQIAEITENTRRGARGLLLPATTRLGNPAEDTLLADTARERGARVHRHTTVHRVPAHRPRAREVPRRVRGAHQSPQTPLRGEAVPP